MKPRTKLQKTVMEYVPQIPPLTEWERQQAFKKMSPHTAILDSKGNWFCLDCGHTWKGKESKNVVCPHCHTKLKREESKKRTFKFSYYFMKVTVCNGFQVFRMFLGGFRFKKGEAAKMEINEVFQRWWKPTGENVIVSRSRLQNSCYYADLWNWNSDLEIRQESYPHKYGPWCTIGNAKVLPQLQKYGIKRNFYGLSPYDLCQEILKNNKIETLWKAGGQNIVEHWSSSKFDLEKYWKSLLVTLRHKYKIKDVSLWRDMIDFLEVLGKDTHNPHYICPKNLKKAHDHWMFEVEKKYAKDLANIEKDKEYKNKLLKAVSENPAYISAKGKYLGLVFKDKEIKITPLQSVMEFLIEGEHHHHCVFKNDYYKKEDILIFHAVIDGISIATIEFSLTTLQIIQCRGKYNKNPLHKDRIIRTIMSNVGKITKCQKTDTANQAA